MSTHGGSGVSPPGGPGVVQSRQHLLAGVGLVYENFYMLCWLPWQWEVQCVIRQLGPTCEQVMCAHVYD